MSQSELAEKLTRIIKSIDRLTRDIQKDAQRVLDTVRELKELGKDDTKDDD